MRIVRARRALLSLGVLLVGACGAAVIGVPVDGRNQTIPAAVGQEIAVTLGSLGPATYASPPTISSNVLTFVGVEVVPPFDPGGATQRFRFRAVAAGQAIVDFQRVLNDSVLSVVEDTVVVH